MKFWTWYLGGLFVTAMILFVIPALMSAKDDMAVVAAVSIVGFSIGYLLNLVYKQIKKHIK